ncbi:MAG: MFS transporter [Chloroflexi bacterium]|nr:MFS transporter [Chloroflexota bacterium]MCY3696293.1 MFS transporter [Chloroflexota bacterium]MXX79975.1 MFS transporter [Chloroflexota bacterium]MYD16849.1 MFS transporter [Chloroflexota bacterium]
MITKLRSAYYGWYLVGAAVICMAVAAGVSFWSLGFYVVPLENEFGWSRALVLGGLSVSLGISGLASPLAGRIVDRQGPRRVIFLGTVATCLSYLLLATTETWWQWFLYLSINSFFRGFMFYIPFQVLISRWFDRKRGRAVGIMATGFSLGVVLVPLMQWIIDEISWQASFVFAAAVLAVLFLPISLLVVRNSPQEKGLAIDGERVHPGQQRLGAGPPQLAGLTVRQAVRTVNFWLIAFAFMTFFFCMFGWMVNGVNVYESYGLPRETVSLLMTIAGLAGIISRPTFGYFAERIPSVELASVGLAVFMCGGILALLLSGGSWVGIGIFIACWMVGSAGGPVLEPLILPRVFGLAHFGAIMGTMFMVETIGQVGAPYIGGWLFDLTQGYDILLIIFICSGIASMLFFTLAHYAPNPRIPSPPVRVLRPLLASLVARTEPQHQPANGVRTVPVNGAGGVESSGSPREAGTGMVD